MAQLYPFLRWLWIALGGVLISGPLGNFFYDLYTDPKHAQASVILDFLVTHQQAELAALCFTLLLTGWSWRASKRQEAAAEQQRQEQADQERRTREVTQQPTVHAQHISSGRDSIVTTGPIQTGGQQTGSVSGDAVAGDKYEFHLVAPSAFLFPLHQLRAPVQDFVGRTPEQERLIEALRTSGQVSISGIQGMGGIGKTELALVVANAVQADYPDAQLVVDLRGTEQPPREPADALRACIRAFLGPEVRLPETVDELTPAYTHVLSGKRALLLLDNAADSAQVRPFLPPVGCALLVTSRNQLSLPGLTSIVLEQLAPAEAHALLVRIASRVSAAEAEQISELCGHLPLALRAAGSLLAVTPDLAPVDYIEQLRDVRTRLTHIGHEGVERDVEASFTLSYAYLSPETAHVFRSLAVFPASFDAAAAEAVCEDKDHVSLSELVRRSLVLYDAAVERYRFHSLVRVFADHRLSEGGRAAREERHARYYCDVAAKANQLYLQGGEGVGQGLTLFDREWDNIQAGYSWAVSHSEDMDRAAQLCISYSDLGVHCLDLRLLPRQRIEWLGRSLAAARRIKDRQAEGCVLGNLGVACADVGEVSRAIEYHEQHFVIAREIGDPSGECLALGNLGLIYVTQGKLRCAIEKLEEALELARLLNDRRNEGNVLGNLGLAYTHLGKWHRAIEYYEKQLNLMRELGDHLGEGNALGNIGNIYLRLDDPSRALQFYEQRLVIAHKMGDRRGKSTVLGNMGSAYLALADRKRAVDYYEQQLTIAGEIEDLYSQGSTLGNLADIWMDLGKADQAIACCEQHLTISRKIGNRRGEGISLFNMSLALETLGNRSEAIPKAEEALAIFEQIQDPDAERIRELLAQWRAPEPEEK